MNYACAFLMFILVSAEVYWYIRGRAVYTGPITEAVADELSESEVVTNETDKKTAV